MIEVEFIEWERFIFAHRRGVVGPFERRNITLGDDSFVEFWEKRTCLARMTVFKSNTDKMSEDCERKFELHKKIPSKIKGVYIPDPEWLDSIEDAYEDRGLWEQNANWLVYKKSVEEGTPDPGWIPEDFPQELIDAFHRSR